MLVNQQLLEAVRKGQKSEVRHLLNQGANPNFVYTISASNSIDKKEGSVVGDDDGMDGWTPLRKFDAR
jgi:hypothetical protein